MSSDDHMDSSSDEEDDHTPAAAVESEPTDTAPRTKNEVLPHEIPLENVPINVDENASLIIVGTVRSVVGDTIIVQSAVDAAPVEPGSLLCCAGSNTPTVSAGGDDSGPPAAESEEAGQVSSSSSPSSSSSATTTTTTTTAAAAAGNGSSPLRAKHVHAIVLGKVDEIFGPVAAPLYVVRMEPLRAACLREQLASDQSANGGEQSTVYAVGTELKYVAMSKVNVKGSDASNLYDEEPDIEEITDFSDDEAEAQAKQARRRRRNGGNGGRGGRGGGGSRSGGGGGGGDGGGSGGNGSGSSSSSSARPTQRNAKQRSRQKGGEYQQRRIVTLNGRGDARGHGAGGSAGGSNQSPQQSIPSLMDGYTPPMQMQQQQFQPRGGIPHLGGGGGEGGFASVQQRGQQQQQPMGYYQPPPSQQFYRFGARPPPPFAQQYGFYPPNNQHFQMQQQQQQQQYSINNTMQLPRGPVPSLQPPSNPPPSIVDRRFQGQ